MTTLTMRFLGAFALLTGDTAAVMANARRHEKAMNSGLDHEDARAAAHR